MRRRKLFTPPGGSFRSVADPPTTGGPGGLSMRSFFASRWLRPVRCLGPAVCILLQHSELHVTLFLLGSGMEEIGLRADCLVQDC